MEARRAMRRSMICRKNYCKMQIAKCKLQSVRYLSGSFSSWQLLAVCTSLVFAWPPIAARADFIELTGGGRLEGKLLPADEANKLNCTIELVDGGRVTIARSRVAKIETVTDTVAEYQKLARTS